MKPLLSILTPTIPQRIDQLDQLSKKILRQIHTPTGACPVEHLIFSDNRARSIGAKRQALLDAARGEYVAFVDDDDDVSDDYVASLLRGIETGVGVVTFQQRAIYNGQESTVVFSLSNQDEPFNPGGITRRGAWHVCAWRRELVAHCVFPFMNYGEDKAWSLQARQRARSEIHIPRIIHTYRHDATTTAAPEPS